MKEELEGVLSVTEQVCVLMCGCGYANVTWDQIEQKKKYESI